MLDVDRVPPRLPADRLLLDFLPFECRALTRPGLNLFRVAYSAKALLPMRQRDTQRRAARVVVYDPRSLTTIWVLDETTDTYVVATTRVPRPDMTLAQSQEARRALRTLKSQDRTGARLFENHAQVLAIQDAGRTATTRRKAERARQGIRSASEGPSSRAPLPRTPDQTTNDQLPAPAWAGCEVIPFGDVERL